MVDFLVLKFLFKINAMLFFDYYITMTKKTITRKETII
jgi:hypothetical protein